jgi:RES domain-containing protein
VASKTDAVVTCYRIGDPTGRFPIVDTEGARLFPGRWNTPLSPILYTSEHYSTALLEKLVHLNGVLPANQHYVRITIPSGTSFEAFDPREHPGWDRPSESMCKRFGEHWYEEGRSAVLFVPSIPARVERNVLINLEHADARSIKVSAPEPLWWDDRLFAA